MVKKEKIFLLQLTLEDIRGDWLYDCEERAEVARGLAEELCYTHMVEKIKRFISYVEEGDVDGRYFRTSFDNGGYEGMEKLHGLPRTLEGKSKEFYSFMVCNLNNPDMQLNDWDAQEAVYEKMLQNK